MGCPSDSEKSRWGQRLGIVQGNGMLNDETIGLFSGPEPHLYDLLSIGVPAVLSATTRPEGIPVMLL